MSVRFASVAPCVCTFSRLIIAHIYIGEAVPALLLLHLSNRCRVYVYVRLRRESDTETIMRDWAIAAHVDRQLRSRELPRARDQKRSSRARALVCVCIYRYGFLCASLIGWVRRFILFFSFSAKVDRGIDFALRRRFFGLARVRVGKDWYVEGRDFCLRFA